MSWCAPRPFDACGAGGKSRADSPGGACVCWPDMLSSKFGGVPLLLVPIQFHSQIRMREIKEDMVRRGGGRKTHLGWHGSRSSALASCLTDSSQRTRTWHRPAWDSHCAQSALLARTSSAAGLAAAQARQMPCNILSGSALGTIIRKKRKPAKMKKRRSRGMPRRGNVATETARTDG